MQTKKARPWLRAFLIFNLVSCSICALVGFIFRNMFIAYGSLITEVMESPDYASGLDTPEAILDYLAAEPDTAAIVSYTVDENGGILDDGTAVFHNPDRPMPLASTMKILVLAAYAEAEAAGQLDPQTTLPVSDWERYYLPATDGSAHPTALENLGLETNEQGFATDPQATVTIDDVLWAMIRYSDNAATDYVLTLLEPDATEQLAQAQGFTDHEPIPPLVGIFLSWQNHEAPILTAERTEELVALSSAEKMAEAKRWETLFITDAAWREAELEWRENDRVINRIPYEMTLANSAPAATARTYATMMGQVITGQFISAEVSQIMRRYLEWPMAEFASNRTQFEAFGTKGGSLASVSTDASYVIPKSGDFANQPRVTVLFQANMPFSAWLTQAQTFAQQSFAIKLATEEAFAAEVRSRFDTSAAE